MAHSVPSFMASFSVRCHYKQGTRTHHSPPDSMQEALITPLGPLTAPSGAASGRLVVKFEATKEKKDLQPVLCLGPQAGLDSHLLPPKAVTALNNFRPKVPSRRLNFDSNIKSSMVNEK
ncbi:hypothetical protein E2C01_096802 [Portunus trituberculatus]|uniref:Uncharacterized protein n=1 Tax=Portunus trituberculatus TaxID=210409 RepID=A0A5B7JYT4_PORTR|nr:hypothetical protein [Portunus trituberculatus]